MKIWNYSAILATTATAAQVADIQSAYLTHATPETRAKDTSLHGCNCKFLNDASYTAGPDYDETVDWVCRGWRLARNCVLGQESICSANNETAYEFSGDCNYITGDSEVCQKALCNLDQHFAQELHVLANDNQWTATQIYTDVDNPGVCALLGNRRATINKCCVSATGVYTYLQQNHASDFESQCTLPIDTGDSTETLVHSASTSYTEDPVRGWNRPGHPSQLASFEQDGIIYHGGGNYIEGFFANNGSVAKTYRKENSNSADLGHTEMIWPFEYQGTNYIATANAQGTRVITIYKRDEPDSPFKKFKFDGARKVKVRGDKILAGGELRCCISTIPQLLAVENTLTSTVEFRPYASMCFERESTYRIRDCDFDDNYVWVMDNQKVRKFDINTGAVLFDCTDSTYDVDYWRQMANVGNYMMIYDGKLFIVNYSRASVLIVNTDDRVVGYYYHIYGISTFKISNGLFMFTDNRQRDVDTSVVTNSNAQREVGNLFICDIEDFMAAAANFASGAVDQNPANYDRSSFLIHEVDGKNIGRARTIEISGDSVFVLGHFSYYGDEIRRFTFSN